jgi:hypothetical protein
MDTMNNAAFARTFAALPPELQREVVDFAEFLLAKSRRSAVGDAHPLALLAGVWSDEHLSDSELLSQRSLGREIDL